MQVIDDFSYKYLINIIAFIDLFIKVSEYYNYWNFVLINYLIMPLLIEPHFFNFIPIVG